MGITVPSSLPDLAMAERVRGQDVELEDWKRIAEIAHFLWGATQGQRGSIPFPDGDDITIDHESFATEFTTYSKVSRPMGGFWAKILLDFRVVNSGSSGELEVLVDRVENSTITNIGSVRVGLSTRTVASIDLDWSDVLAGGTEGNARQTLRYRWRFAADDSANPPLINGAQWIERVTLNPQDFESGFAELSGDGFGSGQGAGDLSMLLDVSGDGFGSGDGAGDLTMLLDVSGDGSGSGQGAGDLELTPGYHGLSPRDQTEMFFALREDTIVDDTGGMPAAPSDLGIPFDGTEVQYWSDATALGAWFSTGGDTVNYDADSPSGVAFLRSNGHECMVVESTNLWNSSNIFHRFLHGGFSMNIGIRVHLFGISSTQYQALVATGQRSDSNVFWLGYQDVGSGPELRVLLKDGGATIYDESFSISPSSGHDEIYVEHLNSSFLADNLLISFNGSYLYNSAPANAFPDSPNNPSGQLTIGGVYSGGTQTDHSDVNIQGVAADRFTGTNSNGTDVGACLNDWIAGGVYLGAD